ncbi:capsular biosynthesis protein [Enterovirga aerilata]|uniref:Capsular biosynthesis protein n=1 Tax=Enterovirga aerilata TaxID=2730920 RepID=A0A849IBE0_9HYPH|nr:capsular biosynthesis protein [Enterovirga sp. DB1703]
MVEPAPAKAASPRTFLFLQGLASPFFAELGRALIARGHRVRRINISLGDEIFWRLPATNYRGSLANWRGFLASYLASETVTDIVLFGDCRPYHRVAISLAAHRRIQVHVCEEGYIRPNWITIERGGVNGYSSLPRDPATVRALAAELPDPVEVPFASNFARRALWDVTYNFANMAGRPVYMGYRRHRPNHVLVEYAGWLKRLTRRRRTVTHAEAESARALAHPGGFYLVPLQLDSDYQIRVHSQYAVLAEFLDEVFGSFAKHAPPEPELLVKVHPLDNGLINRPRQVAELAEKHGIAHRVRCIEGGHLPTLLEKTLGVVVVNSTVGLTAIEVGRPTVALGTSIYDIPGLAFQDGLDRFWTELTPPDRDLFWAFRKLVIHRTQVNGGFFCKTGVGLAVRNAVERLEAEKPYWHFAPVEQAAELPDADIYGRPLPAE